jgi:hypothetical protein
MFKKLVAALWALIKKKTIDTVVPPEEKPPAEVAYTVHQGGDDQRIERVARAVEFDIVPAKDGTQEVEPCPVWAYFGTNPDTWNGGNNTGVLSVRVKANNTGSYELKVGPTDAGVKEPDVQGPCKTGVKIHMKFELLADGVRFTTKWEGGTDSKFVKCGTSGDHTVGIGWPPQKRSGLIGAKITNIVWS